MAAKRKSAPAPEPSAVSPADAALDAALRLAATRKWSDLTMPDIAAEAGLTLGEMLRATPSKAALLAAFGRRVDGAMLARPADADGTVKDKLFDLMMRRFDALGPHKAAVKNILADLPRDPGAALCALPGFLRAMRWTAEAAGIKTTGLLAPLKINALAMAYLITLRVWLQDDSADAAKTMASLDKTLDRLSALASSFPGFPRSRQASESA
ncbi:MAG: TetR family transcriptional regulator [Tagaea sp.]